MSKHFIAVVAGLVCSAALLTGCNSSTSGHPPGISSARFQQMELSHVRSAGYRSASYASCIYPDAWVPGKTFKCFIYRHNNSLVGIVHNTVLVPRSSQSFDINWEFIPN